MAAALRSVALVSNCVCVGIECEALQFSTHLQCLFYRVNTTYIIYTSFASCSGRSLVPAGRTATRAHAPPSAERRAPNARQERSSGSTAAVKFPHSSSPNKSFVSCHTRHSSSGTPPAHTHTHTCCEAVAHTHTHFQCVHTCVRTHDMWATLKLTGRLKLLAISVHVKEKHVKCAV